MMLSLIARNVYRSLPRLRPMILALGTAIAVLVLGNSISRAVNTGYREVYTEHVTGDVTLSAASDRSFTVFGSDALLVGQYLIPPVLLEASMLERAVQEIPGVEGTAGLVTVAARVRIAGRSDNQPLFGVEFADYAALFPQLQLLRGELPGPGERGAVIHESRFADLARPLGEEPPLGSPVVISVYNDYSFTIREVPLAGVFAYPVSDPLLDRVALVDVQTARELNGYMYAASAPEVGAELDYVEVDDLFGVADDLQTADQSLDRTDIEERLQADDPADSQALQPLEGAWNFVLVRLSEDARAGGAARIAGELHDAKVPAFEEVRVRGWRESAGGNAVLIWAVQILLNVGLMFVAVGAAVVTVNALVLSVLERTREIGTMRALGATRTRVGLLVAGETLALVAGAGILGIGAGVLLVEVVNLLQIEISNPVLQVLFGRGNVTGQLSLSLIADHLGLCVGLGLVSMIYPLAKSLKIPPVKAMASA